MNLSDKSDQLNTGLLSDGSQQENSSSYKSAEGEKNIDDAFIDANSTEKQAQKKTESGDKSLTLAERTQKELEEESSQMSRVQTCRFFLKHSCKDIGRRKCHFCLAFMSVFLVVLATLVIHSVVDKGPIIFMTLGQSTVGAFDGYYVPR